MSYYKRVLWLSAAALLLPQVPALAQTSQPPQVAAADLEEIVVMGRVQKLYRAEETTVGKMPGNPLDIPQAVQVLTRQLMEDQGARDATDLYRNISGISFFSYAGVTFRGFRQEGVYYDGMRGDPFIGFSVPQLFNIARIEVLKGPAGMLYGPASPGGTINYVSKTPRDTFSGELKLIGGDYNRYGGSAEVTGPIVAGKLDGRAGFFYEKKDSFRMNAENRALIGDAGLTYRVNDDIDAIAQYTHYDQNLPGNRLRGVQVNMNGDFLSPITWNHNEPTDFLTTKSDVYQGRVTWRPDGGFGAEAAVRYFEAREAQEYHEQRDLLDTNADGVADTITREFRDQRRTADGLAFSGNVRGDVPMGAVNNRILLGADWYEENTSQLSRTFLDPTRGGPVPNLSLINPVYGIGGGSKYNVSSRPYTLSAAQSRRWGIYLQDQVLIGEQFIVVGGIRHDGFYDVNKVSNVNFKNDDQTYRVGAIYKVQPDISVYASWSDTFETQTAANQDPSVGGPFDPIRGSQIEGGVKTALMDGRIQGNAAIYRIVRENILQTDTTRPPVNGRNQLAPIGEVTAKGFEFDLAADVTPDWVLTFNYGYNDTRVTDTVTGQAITNAVGDRFVNAPKHKLGFWSRYQVESIRTAFAFGGEHVSERVGFDRERVKPYTVFDATVIKTFDFAEVMLRVENVFDKVYAASGFGLRNGSFPGEPRTFFVEIRKSF